MAARSMATGTISFGLVTVPIRLYSAAESAASISFNLLHEKCKSRLKQHYTCEAEGVEVPRTEMVKGYQFAKGQYVTFTNEEIKAMEESPNSAIEITEFVSSDRVDPVFFDNTYYVGPDKGGDKAYKLLSEAMRQTGRCALAKWAARGKMYLVMLRPTVEGGGLAMQILHYADEVRPFSEVPVGDAVIKEQELKLAVQLIDQISAEEFHPEKYTDEVKTRMQTAIQGKVEGQEVIAPAAETPRAQIIDLMEALKASLAAQGAGEKKKAERKPARPAPREVVAEEAPRKRAAGGRR